MKIKFNWNYLEPVMETSDYDEGAAPSSTVCWHFCSEAYKTCFVLDNITTPTPPPHTFFVAITAKALYMNITLYFWSDLVWLSYTVLHRPATPCQLPPGLPLMFMDVVLHSSKIKHIACACWKMGLELNGSWPSVHVWQDGSESGMV